MKIAIALYYNRSLVHGVIDTDLLEKKYAEKILDNASSVQAENARLCAPWDTLNTIQEALVYDYPYQVEGRVTLCEDEFDDFEDDE